MPVPLIFAIAAGIAAATGVGTGVKGGIDMKNAKNMMEKAKERHAKNRQRFESKNTATTLNMDKLGKKQLTILSDFKEFSNVWEKIDNKPEFGTIKLGNVEITTHSSKELEEVSIGASALLGGLGGAALGTAGGFAAAGAVPAVIASVAVASTGTAMSTLSGVALTNAVLAWLGGGSLAVGGGGMALGATILGASTAGIGLLIGGVVFAVAGSGVAKKAYEAYDQVLEEEKIIDEICYYLEDLQSVARNYYKALVKVSQKYNEFFHSLKSTVAEKGNWKDFTPEEKLNAENTVLAVGLLYDMCNVKLVLTSPNKNGKNEINRPDVKKALANSDNFCEKFISCNLP